MFCLLWQNLIILPSYLIQVILMDLNELKNIVLSTVPNLGIHYVREQ